MIGRAVKFATLLENVLVHRLIKYHCIIQEEALSGKTLSLQPIILPVVKCVNKITARGLNLTKKRYYIRPFSEQSIPFFFFLGEG